MIHLDQLGSTTSIDMQKAREEELDLLVDAINKETIIQREKRKEQLQKIDIEQTKFLTKSENMARQFITIMKRVNTHKPLGKAYQLFESVVPKIQE